MKQGIELMMADIHVKKLVARDVAKEVIVEEDFDGSYYRCPICKRIIFGTEKFCPECGQRLKW